VTNLKLIVYVEIIVSKPKKILSKTNSINKACKYSMHPEHKKEGIRLKRVRGQIDGILAMIDDRRYCPDILIQIRAAKAAIQAVELSVLNTHLDNCVSEAMHSKDENKAKEKINELIQLIGRHK
jgi:DNA-binding FrmR family transcriptional regulator